ncbi:unnamed protein product [Orchesella dallaii]|uniref:XK-related protein n=1 Tax=Orchesella dallaii TaxID=48710 RepID=A0ABP1Q8H9_9HEXA
MTQSYTVTKSDKTNNGSDGAPDVGIRLLSSNLNSEGEISIIHSSTNMKNGSNEKPEKTEVKDEDGKCRKCVHWTKVIWSFVTFVISVTDVLVIIYLSYLHFHHSSDIIAWLMLLPILMNFIGIFTFLSDDDERREMEDLGCQNVIWQNLMFFPVIGPSVSALKLFVLSFREHEAERFERLESLLTRMKQYESFFRAAPEAFVQLTFRIITWSRAKVFHEEDYWTNLCLSLCLFALAEANMYTVPVPYYQMFHRNKDNEAWRIDHIGIPWRIALFFFTFLSIESRLYADAILKATACFYFHEFSFGEVLIVTFLCQFMVRAALYSFFTGFLGSKRLKKRLRDTGVYGAFTYSWRALFMSFDFQSFCAAVFLSFYIENLILITGSYVIIYTLTDVDLSDKYIFHVYAILSIVSMLIAIGLRFLLRRRWQMRTCRNKVVAQD